MSRISPFALAFAALALVAMLAFALPATGATVTKTLVAKESGCTGEDALCFDTETISAVQGDTLTLTFQNPAANQQPHNLCIKIDQNLLCTPETDEYVEPGDPQAQLSVAASKAGSWEYWCNVPGHKTSGMLGTLTVSSAGGNDSTPPPKKQPGFEAALALAGIAAAVLVVARRRT